MTEGKDIHKVMGHYSGETRQPAKWGAVLPEDVTVLDTNDGGDNNSNKRHEEGKEE
jgi:hypothetical protein